VIDEKKFGISIAVARISLGLVFFWAFIDKLLGLGFSACRDATTREVTYFCSKAWISGGSPTTGFLSRADGVFGAFFKSLAGAGLVDWLFMIGLLGLGIALIFGIGIRIAAITGSILLVLMWLAELPLATNPILDDHLIYAMLLWVIYYASAGDYYGLGKWWKEKVTNAWLH
jgi:thiosulfate dehydrogenase (quinone) large subunit